MIRVLLLALASISCHASSYYGYSSAESFIGHSLYGFGVRTKNGVDGFDLYASARSQFKRFSDLSKGPIHMKAIYVAHFMEKHLYLGNGVGLLCQLGDQRMISAVYEFCFGYEAEFLLGSRISFEGEVIVIPKKEESFPAKAPSAPLLIQSVICPGLSLAISY